MLDGLLLARTSEMKSRIEISGLWQRIALSTISLPRQLVCICGNQIIWEGAKALDMKHPSRSLHPPSSPAARPTSDESNNKFAKCISKNANKNMLPGIFPRRYIDFWWLENVFSSLNSLFDVLSIRYLCRTYSYVQLCAFYSTRYTFIARFTPFIYEVMQIHFRVNHVE